MAERDLISRLENWAAAQRSRPRQGAAESIEGRYRSGYRESNARPTELDLIDAALVNEAWKRCVPLERDILQLHYVWRAHSDFICRRLRIKHRPASIWEFALAHAHSAIARRIAIEEEVEVSAV